jgi:hypothetical protein
MAAAAVDAVAVKAKAKGDSCNEDMISFWGYEGYLKKAR